MFKIKQILFIFSAFILCQQGLLEGAFTSPSQKQIGLVPFSDVEQSFKIRKIFHLGMDQFDAITDTERTGFLGYHGDSIEFMIYQDIIRSVFEIILEVPIRKDFHFLAVPLDPAVEIQTKAKLVQVFTEHENPSLPLSESTFPLNFSIWDNYNRLGLNSIELYLKNESLKTLGYQKRLKWLFKRLGINEQEINAIFTDALQKLNSPNGVLLQIFDDSEDPYAFAKKIAYPAYPNGYISENQTVDEIFLDESYIPPYPHEVRLMLNTHETLNPKNPLKIVRHIPNISSSVLEDYEKELKNNIKKLSFKKKEVNSYRAAVQKSWGK